MAHMSWQEAFDYAFRMALLHGCWYRVYKSRSVTGWWVTYLLPNSGSRPKNYVAPSQ